MDVGNPVAGVRADSVDGFMFDHGAAHRLISEAGPSGMRATLSIPGGASGVLGSADYFNLLPGWLVNAGFPLLLRTGEVQANAASTTEFVPASKSSSRNPRKEFLLPHNRI